MSETDCGVKNSNCRYFQEHCSFSCALNLCLLDYTVWADLISNLSDIAVLLQSDPSCFTLFSQYVHDLISVILPKVGWTKVEGESHTTSLLRARIIGVAIKYEHPETVQTALNKFAAFFGSGQAMNVAGADAASTLSPDLRSSVYSAVVAHGGAFGYQCVKMIGEKSSLSEEKVRCLNALGSSTQSDLLLRTLGDCITSAVRTQDGPSLISTLAGNRHGTALAWAFCMENWDAILKKYQQSSSLSRIVGQIGNVTSRQVKQQVEEFFKSHSHPGAERSVKQGIERSDKRGYQWSEDEITEGRSELNTSTNEDHFFFIFSESFIVFF